eukprot:10556459-Karenia_brevis.AAC.1
MYIGKWTQKRVYEHKQPDYDVEHHANARMAGAHAALGRHGKNVKVNPQTSGRAGEVQRKTMIAHSHSSL